jgi:hypothetical protein
MVSSGRPSEVANISIHHKGGGVEEKRKERTYLDDLVPTGRDDDGDNGVGGESDTRDPFRVTIVNNVELALSEGVP